MMITVDANPNTPMTNSDVRVPCTICDNIGEDMEWIRSWKERPMKRPNNSNMIPEARIVRGTVAVAIDADMSI